MADAERNSHEIGVALIGAFTKLFWPVALLIVLLAFHRPVYDAITMIGREISMGGAAVEIAGMKLSLPKGWELPKPPADVAEILPKLDKPVMQFILENPTRTAYRSATCFTLKAGDRVTLADFDQEPGRPLAKLDKLGLASAQPVPNEEKHACFQPHFEELYGETREYLINILSSVDFAELR